MLNAAHAAAYHWRAAGTELYAMRALMLLAHVYALLGDGRTALRYAEEMQAFFLARETPDWEITLTHAIYAQAAMAAGNDESYRRAYAKAAAAFDEIADEEERAIVLETFGRIPIPNPESPTSHRD